MDDLLTWSRAVADPTDTVTVRLTAWLNYDLPDETWDWVELHAAHGETEEQLFSYTGSADNVRLDFSTDIRPGEFGGAFANEVRLKFRVFSDGAWSDEDCFMVSHGAAQVDDISVYLDGVLVSFDDFEAGSPVHWTPGDFGGVSGTPATEVLFVQATPNPCNPTTRITFNLPARAQVAVRIYDTRGRLVRELLAAELEAGPAAVVWDGRDDRSIQVASGVYMYRVQAGTDTKIGKLALLR
jgi:hypothetical protein